MLAQLVESSPRGVRRRFSTLASVAAHALLVSAAVAAARPLPEEPAVRPLITWHPPPSPPPSTRPECTGCGSRESPGPETGINPVPYSFPHTEFRLHVPDSVGSQVEGIQISSDEWERGAPRGRGGDSAAVFGSEGVDRRVIPLATNPVPRYPATLRDARIEGSVSVRFVVDTTGHVLMSSVIVDRAEHPLFAEAVIDVLRRSRFTPAELRGRRVQQLVVQPFVFVIRDR